jgi:hypothetical protein
MLVIASLAIGTILITALVGFPIYRLIEHFSKTVLILPRWTRISIFLILGFGVLSLSASLAYSFIGIDYYPVILFVLTFSMYATVVVLKIPKKGMKLLPWGFKDTIVFLPILFSVYLTRSHWTGLFSPVIHAGNGPDVSQNLMAAQSARDLGDTWGQQGNLLNSFLGTTNLRESLNGVFTYPSFRDQAGLDYLVYGTRWGLTIFYSQILRFFGDGAILWETGFVLLFALITIAIVSYGVISLYARNSIYPVLGSLICVGNAGFLFQYFNGGLSQAFGVIGVLGIFLSLFLTTNTNETYKVNKTLVFLITLSSWTTLLTTYVDSAVIIVFFLIIFFTLLLILKRDLLSTLAKNYILSGFLALVLSPVLSYSTFSILDTRAQSATNTGIKNAVWAFPSELFGFGDGFVSTISSRSSLSTFLGVLFSLLILCLCLFYLKKSILRMMLLSLLITLGITFTFLTKDSNYIYHKVGVYLSYGVVFVVLAILDSSYVVKSRYKKMNLYKSVPILLLCLTLTSTFGAISTSVKLSTQGSTITYNMKELIEDRQLQMRISSYNYLTPYVLSANYLGVLGNFYWISKAPNDIKLATRISNELRLICYEGDPNCNPKTAKIADPELEKFGLVQYQSPITTSDFAALSILKRYEINFEVFGMKPTVIPKKFLGGNPYLN